MAIAVPLGIVGVFLLWVLPMVVAARLCDAKGYGQWVGPLLGLFLGWLGVFVAAVITVKPEAKPEAPAS